MAVTFQTLIADAKKTSIALDISSQDTLATSVKIDEVQSQLLALAPTVAASVQSVKTTQKQLEHLQEETRLLQGKHNHYVDTKKELEDLKTYGCCASVKGSLRSCTMYCCGEMISTISGAVTGGFVFQTTLAAVLGGLGGAVLGCGCLYGCYRIKKLCVH